jgi:hypothetical protein
MTSLRLAGGGLELELSVVGIAFGCNIWFGIGSEPIETPGHGRIKIVLHRRIQISRSIATTCLGASSVGIILSISMSLSNFDRSDQKLSEKLNFQVFFFWPG